jgi:septal ring factor EnvC (AmiA/AmiB activator)
LEKSLEVVQLSYSQQVEKTGKLEHEVMSLRTEKQRIEASLEMAQDDNQTLLDDIKGYENDSAIYLHFHSLESSAERLKELENEVKQVKTENNELRQACFLHCVIFN